jgi:hypothetical protein
LFARVGRLDAPVASAAARRDQKTRGVVSARVADRPAGEEIAPIARQSSSRAMPGI